MKKLIYIAAAIMLLTSIFPTMNYSAPASGIEIILESPEANQQQLEQMADIISIRLERFGVEEYEMNILGEPLQLSVKLTDDQLAKQLLPLMTATGQLEFCEVFTAVDFQQLVKSEEWEEWLSFEGQESSAKLGDIEEQQIKPFLRFAQEQQEQGKLPDNLEFSFSQDTDPENRRKIYALRYDPQSTPILDNQAMSTINIVGSQDGADHISLQFTELGSKHWSEATKNNINRPIAIVIDGLVYSTPVVKEKISSGNAVITGDFSKAEVRLLGALLSNKTLPLPLQLVEVRQ